MLWETTHGAFIPGMMKLPQATWIETFVEGVTDKSIGLPICKELAWFAYKVSGAMCSASVCEHCWCIEGWIHSKRRNKLDQTLVEKLFRAHTTCDLVLRVSLDDTLHHLLPWDIEFIIDEPVDDLEEEPEDYVCIICTHTYFVCSGSRHVCGPTELLCNTLS
jgi:hypothetical protein